MNDEIAKIEAQIKTLNSKKRFFEQEAEKLKSSDFEEKWRCSQEIEKIKNDLDLLYKELNTLQNPPISFRQESIHQKIQPWRFDMQPIMRLCRDEIRTKTKGVIGVAINSQVDKFLENFRDRLLHESNLKQVYKPSNSYPLDERIESPNQVLERLKKHKERLQRQDVFIIVPVRLTEISKANLFWQELCQEFEGQINHRLVAIFGGTVESAFPEPLKPIDSPCFNRHDIVEWMFDFRDFLNWPESCLEQWQEKMLHHCKNKDETLDIFSVFEHIETALNALRECNYQHEEFLENLY